MYYLSAFNFNFTPLPMFQDINGSRYTGKVMFI